MKITKIILIAFNVVIVVFLIALWLSPNSLGKDYFDYIEFRPIPERGEDKIQMATVDESLLTNSDEYIHSDNIYEEEILNKENGNDLYKLIPLSIDGVKSYLVVIYKPEKIHLMLGNGFNVVGGDGRINVHSMMKKYNAIIGINAGGFFDNGVISTDKPSGYIIKDGKILWNNYNKVGKLIGFDYDNKLRLLTATGEEAISKGIRDAIEFGPYLIVDGEITNEAKMMYEYRASRTVIAQRKDGKVLMLATEGGSFVGPKMRSIVEILTLYGAYNAANLDGGLSTQLFIKDKNYLSVTGKSGVYSSKGRPVLDGWGVIE